MNAIRVDGQKRKFGTTTVVISGCRFDRKKLKKNRWYRLKGRINDGVFEANRGCLSLYVDKMEEIKDDEYRDGYSIVLKDFQGRLVSTTINRF